jgi:hypothetical protein
METDGTLSDRILITQQPGVPVIDVQFDSRDTILIPKGNVDRGSAQETGAPQPVFSCGNAAASLQILVASDIDTVQTTTTITTTTTIQTTTTSSTTTTRQTTTTTTISTTTTTVPPLTGKINVYSVKFLCGQYSGSPAGTQVEGPVKPGNYMTAINLHNPNFSPVGFRKKAVLMFADNPAFQQGFEIPRKPGQLFSAALEPDWGLEIDCDDIRDVLLGGILPAPSTGFIKGWVIIESPEKQPLDIVTVYTAHGFRQNLSTGVTETEGFSHEIIRTYPTVVKGLD